MKEKGQHLASCISSLKLSINLFYFVLQWQLFFFISSLSTHAQLSPAMCKATWWFDLISPKEFEKRGRKCCFFTEHSTCRYVKYIFLDFCCSSSCSRWVLFVGTFRILDTAAQPLQQAEWSKYYVTIVTLSQINGAIILAQKVTVCSNMTFLKILSSKRTFSLFTKFHFDPATIYSANLFIVPLRGFNF